MNLFFACDYFHFPTNHQIISVQVAGQWESGLQIFQSNYKLMRHCNITVHIIVPFMDLSQDYSYTPLGKPIREGESLSC